MQSQDQKPEVCLFAIRLILRKIGVTAQQSTNKVDLYDEWASMGKWQDL